MNRCALQAGVRRRVKIDVCIANCALQTGSRDTLSNTGVKVRIAKCTILYLVRSILFSLILFRATYHK